eukprot:CAMPEP_0179154438 /NCGR_PEP_ID=MMETSP0796-20121207/75164_1 /TAXON_ID=73915 /ORGANISM="Pyrodinium bahamense, Strain pbaha01" /LENGTH=77 /DNA_ID=CAMNT_0020855817 /DNA_START=42 /DNA_END=272 /DNA_ORIENTATION=-
MAILLTRQRLHLFARSAFADIRARTQQAATVERVKLHAPRRAFGGFAPCTLGGCPALRRGTGGGHRPVSSAASSSGC